MTFFCFLKLTYIDFVSEFMIASLQFLAKMFVTRVYDFYPIKVSLLPSSPRNHQKVLHCGVEISRCERKSGQLNMSLSYK